MMKKGRPKDMFISLPAFLSSFLSLCTQTFCEAFGNVDKLASVSGTLHVVIEFNFLLHDRHLAFIRLSLRTATVIMIWFVVSLDSLFRIITSRVSLLIRSFLCRHFHENHRAGFGGQCIIFGGTASGQHRLHSRTLDCNVLDKWRRELCNHQLVLNRYQMSFDKSLFVQTRSFSS